MSTDYYWLRDPFTSIRLEEGEVHDRVTLWEGGANCGTLTLRAGHGRVVCRMFADTDDANAPIHTHFGGADVGCVVTESASALDEPYILVSEYGQPLTVGEIRKRSAI